MKSALKRRAIAKIAGETDVNVHMEPLQVKSKSAERREKRTATCREVFNHFHLQLFELNMLCFIDDEDDGDADYEEERSRVLGVSNRGGFSDSVMHRFEVVVASRVTSTADKRIRSRAINYERTDTRRKSVLGSGVPVEIKFADVTAHRYVAGTRRSSVLAEIRAYPAVSGDKYHRVIAFSSDAGVVALPDAL